MEYALAKYCHLLGLALWLGMIPMEIYVHFRLARGASASDAHRMLRVVNRIRFVQEFPGLALTVIGGLWLASIVGFESLLAQRWFQGKLAFLGYLVFAETYLTLASLKLERSLARARSEGGSIPASALEPREVLVESIALFAGACILLLVGFRTLPVFGLIAAVAVAAGVGAVLLRGRQRRTPPLSDGAPAR